MVLHDHRLDATGRLRVDHVHVGEVAQVQQRAARGHAGRIGGAAEQVDAGQVALAGTGDERAVLTLHRAALQHGLQQGARRIGRGRDLGGRRRTDSLEGDAGRGRSCSGGHQELPPGQPRHQSAVSAWA